MDAVVGVDDDVVDVVAASISRYLKVGRYLKGHRASGSINVEQACIRTAQRVETCAHRIRIGSRYLVDHVRGYGVLGFGASGARGDCRCHVIDVSHRNCNCLRID